MGGAVIWVASADTFPYKFRDVGTYAPERISCGAPLLAHVEATVHLTTPSIVAQARIQRCAEGNANSGGGKARCDCATGARSEGVARRGDDGELGVEWVARAAVAESGE